jgi:hypothetical protein
MVIVVRTDLLAKVLGKLETVPATTLEMKSSSPEETPARLVDLLT